MKILTIRTDKPQSELGIYDNRGQIAYITWQAHRQLAETLHQKIDELTKSQNMRSEDIEGIVCYKGPGSFTGLRIGLSVANALAYSLNIPIVGVEGEEGWLEKGVQALKEGANHESVIPEYGAPVHITKPKN